MKTKPLGLILAGGKSLRLFPRSLPKPLLMVNGRPLLYESLDRLKGFETFVICNGEIARETKRVFGQLKKKCPQFLKEPEGRDTAAAVGFGLKMGHRKSPRAEWAAILSADQWMPDYSMFPKFLQMIESEIEKYPDALFVAGSPAQSKPRSTHSQFGWIEAKKGEAGSSRRVARFIEKPQGELLEDLRANEGLINAGMFYGRVDTFLKAFKELYPDVLNPKVKYKNLVRQPVDKAIFEKFSHVRVVSLPMRWEDLGTWEDWYDHVKPTVGGDDLRVHLSHAKLAKEHRVYGTGKRVLVAPQSLKEIHVYGVSDLAVVEDSKKLLVMPLSQSRDLKKFLEAGDFKSLASPRTEWTEERPWGRFKNLLEAGFCKVKLIEVDPEKRLSYQSHAQRRESWTVVSGEALVTLNDVEHRLKAGEHIDIPLQAKHRISNPHSKQILRFVEVQTGSYFGEDDIKRFQDDWGR